MQNPDPNVRFQRLSHGGGIPVPAYQSDFAAGVDLYAATGETTITLYPGAMAMIPTGFNIAIDPGYEGSVRPRSGLAAKYGISIVNSPGTIDADYRGEIKVMLINHGAQPCKIARGDRIAQLVINPVARAKISEVVSLDATQRGEGGFGSTGVS